MERRLQRLVACAFLGAVAFAMVGLNSAGSNATFASQVGASSNSLGALKVDPPAAHNTPVSAVAGAVNLSWTTTPTNPGTHPLTYLVFRRVSGIGSYVQIGSSASLAYSDTPAADGLYDYVIESKVASGSGFFTSVDSAVRTGRSDRTAPAMSIQCNSTACSAGWYTATVSVTVSGTDAGTGMGSVTRQVDAAANITTGGSSVTFNVAGNSAGHTVAYFGTDAAGNVSGTSNQTIKIDAANPTPATGLTSAQGSGGPPITIGLNWSAATDAHSGVQGYEVRWTNAITNCPAANTTNFPNTATVGAVTAYTITGLANNDDYCAYVVAIDNAGNRSANSTVTGPTRAK